MITVPMPRTSQEARPRPTKLGGLLVSWMAENGYTLEDVAKAVGLKNKTGAQTVSRWRNGKAFPNPSNEHDLARMMGVEIADFYPPGTFSPKSSSLDQLRETVEELRSRFDIAEEDLLDRITALSERVAVNEGRIYELVGQLRAQGWADLQGVGFRSPQQESAEPRKPIRSVEDSSPPTRDGE